MSVKENITVIGLTGMSGAGKSTACKVFRNNDFEIIDCDLICREIVKKGKPCLSEIACEFGDYIITSDGELNRSSLSRKIFANEHKRLALNGIMYPYVSYIVIKKILTSKNNYVILDAPTLFESGIDDICDLIVCVVAEKNSLMRRIMERDNIDYELAANRLNSQKSAEYYIERSDYVIVNNGTSEELISNVMEIIDNVRKVK